MVHIGKIEPSEIHSVVIGTAGHIDHGKSTLVKLLTGIDPDRLPEEKERGMTIDLGFAPYKTKDGKYVGIVDVPGHERFVKNMVAGATGIDFVILVVAANDSVMPQTIEHLNIMNLLGLKKGLIALTKIDMVECEMIELVKEDVRILVKGTFLENAPLLSISSVTNKGIDELKKELERSINEITPRAVGSIFIMPVQRVFAAKGFGTVVTGIPVSGSVRVGDAVEVLPAKKISKIRSMQAYRYDVDSIRAGHSSAINLSDVEHTLVNRGDVVATPGFLSGTSYLEAEFTFLPVSTKIFQKLPQAMYVRFHSGTSEVLGKMSLLDKKSLSQKEKAFVGISFNTPVIVAPGDRYIIRLQSPVITLGGGRVIENYDLRKTLRRLVRIERLKDKLQAFDDKALRVRLSMKDFGFTPFKVEELVPKALIPQNDIVPLVDDIAKKGDIIFCERLNGWIHRENFEGLMDVIASVFSNLHEKDVLRLGHEKSAIQKSVKVAPELFDMAMVELVRRGTLCELGEGLYKLSGFTVELTTSQKETMKKIVAVYLNNKFSTPSVTELVAIVGGSQETVLKILKILVNNGDIIDLGDGIMMHRKSVELAKGMLIDEITKNGSIETGAFRNKIDTTRKYVVPLLEYCDKVGLTKREGNIRKLI